MLLAHDPDIRLDDALCEAATFGHLPVIKSFLDHGAAAAAHKRTNLGEAILAAFWNDRLDSLRYLVFLRCWDCSAS